ncbi:unnamed protein product [Rotaria socialis]|uniref:Uncharacterized protein n=1 Tax=Rotaria socialis TaxID=392032 RepID=A0A818WIE0_9BILA|nr:unnamed protein product [Rotaria socialis]CAF3771131.1 unnamed protein product [Rotaria socialis]CAF4383017.1 unnamed protein product [Rotaria socialis]CAF4530875.1 unnamed protein product [Rotaria socialis]
MNDITDDPLDFASTLDDRFIKTGQDEGHHYGYQRGFRQGFCRGLDYALENHREIAIIAAYCAQLLGQLNSTNDSNPRQRRLLNGITESCREFRTLLPDAPRYAELLASIRARHQHLTGAGNNTIEASNLNF